MELKDGVYRIGGVPVQDIVSLAGTPVYVYDAGNIERQVARMRSAFASVPVRILYACKALTNLSVLRLMRRLGCGLDAVSIQEVEIGLRAGFKPEEILFTPNMVSFAEYERAVEIGVTINIDSLAVLVHFGHAFGGRVPVCLRFNPHILAGGNERISTGHIDSKFGISIHQLRHVQRVVASNGLRVNGLHMHTGSDILDAEVFLQGAEILLDIAGEFRSIGNGRGDHIECSTRALHALHGSPLHGQGGSAGSSFPSVRWYSRWPIPRWRSRRLDPRSIEAAGRRGRHHAHRSRKR